MDTYFNRAYIDLQLEQADLLATHLHGTSDLLLQNLDEKTAMARFPIQTLTSEIRIDGRVEDWKNQIKNAELFGVSKIRPSFEAMIGKYDNKLNLVVRVIDDTDKLLSVSNKITQLVQINLYLLNNKKQQVMITILPTKSSTINFKYSNKLPITKKQYRRRSAPH